MAEAIATMLLVLAAGSALLAWAAGGVRFRRWAIQARTGKPRFPEPIETILLWLVYSAGVSAIVALALQVLRALG